MIPGLPLSIFKGTKHRGHKGYHRKLKSGKSIWINAAGVQVPKEEVPDSLRGPGIGTHLLEVVLPDGTRKRIEPDKSEVDARGNVKGGAKAVREIIERGLFGEYGYHTKGKKRFEFWVKPGILMTYSQRTTRKGKLVVSKVPIVDGYTHLEWRTPSLASHVWPRGIPAKYSKLKLDIEDTMHRRPTGKLKRPGGPAMDTPAVLTVPASSTSTSVAVGPKLNEAEDPIALAQAMMAVTWGGKSDTDVSGLRKLKPLPAWAVDKFDSPAHLQQELSQHGKPLTTLITLGMWRKKDSTLNTRLSNEWSGHIRSQVSLMSQAYSLTDSFKRKGEEDAVTGGQSANAYKRELVADLYQMANEILYEEANNYISNDDPSKDSRFDIVAARSLNTRLKAYTRQVAKDHGTPYALIDELLPEDPTQDTRAAAFMSPQEMFELRQYAPAARANLRAATRALSTPEALVFNARHWLDAAWLDSSVSETEQEFHEKRLTQGKRVGTQRVSWLRPYAAVIRDLPAGYRVPDGRLLTDLSESTQRTVLSKLIDSAGDKVRTQLMHDGKAPQVERWLRLEAKLATHNRSIVATVRDTHRINPVTGEVTPETHGVYPKFGQLTAKEIAANKNRKSRSHRESVSDDPAVAFWRTAGANQELGRTLGLVGRDNSDKFGHFTSPNIMNIQNAHIEHARKFHKEVASASKVADASAHLTGRVKARQSSEKLGHWGVGETGSREWKESAMSGIVGFHLAAEAAVASGHPSTPETKKFTKLAIKMQKHPHLSQIASLYRHKVALLDTPSHGDLAYAKNISSAETRRLRHLEHIARYEKKRRGRKTTSKSLRKAFASYDRAITGLVQELAA